MKIPKSGFCVVLTIINEYLGTYICVVCNYLDKCMHGELEAKPNLFRFGTEFVEIS